VICTARKKEKPNENLHRVVSGCRTFLRLQQHATFCTRQHAIACESAIDNCKNSKLAIGCFRINGRGDKTSISYKIKVNTDKPIEEVHLALKETDAGGKVVEQTMIAWQNIVHSTQQPIEKGKTYEDQMALDPAATKAECTLKEVVFKDGTRWTAR